jgi:hypothetical protein
MHIKATTNKILQRFLALLLYFQIPDNKQENQNSPLYITNLSHPPIRDSWVVLCGHEQYEVTDYPEYGPPE